MNSTLTLQLRLYYRTIHKLLDGTSKEKKEFMHTLKLNIQSYIAANSVTDISEIYAQFGSAEEIADTYISGSSHNTLSTQIKHLNLFNLCIILTIIGMIAFFFLFVRILRSIPIETVIM